MALLLSRATSGLRPPVAPRAGRGSRLVLFSSVAALFAGISGCGSRSALLEASPGEAGGTGGTTSTGGTTGTGGAPTTTSTSTTPSLPSCSSLTTQPTLVLPQNGTARTKPRTALLPGTNDALLMSVQNSGTLRGGHLAAFGDWPPSYQDELLLEEGVVDYDIGPGPHGPVAVTQNQSAGPLLFTSIYPSPEPLNDIPILDGDRVLFAMGVEDRYFYARSTQTPDYEVLGVGSYQPNNLPQTEQPLVCTKSPLLGAAVPSGQGFLAVYTEPAQVDGTCVPDDPAPGTLMSLHRYDSPPDAVSFLQHTEGAKLTAVTPEPLVHLGLTPASFGAWLVYQSDGSTAEVPPPIFGLRVDESGQPLDPPVSYGVSPGGYISPEVAVASLGDTLAVAWVEAVDPSAPVILVQLLHPDGTLGPSVSIPTNDAWLSSDLRLLASAGATHLLVSWGTGPDQPTVALARIDCIQ